MGAVLGVIRSKGWQEEIRSSVKGVNNEVKLPLVDHKGRLNIAVKGHPKRKLYWGDLFHTLVNLPGWRFTAVLFVTYTSLFVSFSIPYYFDAKSNNCIPGITTFVHAVWFSVQTSMTIGYGGELTPDPDCTMTNALVALQSVASLLVAYSLLGVLYARFSRPTRRASTLAFSHNMVMHEENGVAKLSFRVANIRKHQVIEAHVRMLLALNSIWTAENEAIFRFTSLPVLGGSQLFLGLPCIVSHPVNSNSPLFGLSYAMMERCDMEILVLLEGVDASTSARLQARHSYRPSDICHNHRFATMVTRQPCGLRRVDFTLFHAVVPVSPSQRAPLAPLFRVPLHESRRSQQSPPPPPLPPILQTPKALPVDPYSCPPLPPPSSHVPLSASNAEAPPILQTPTALPNHLTTLESPCVAMTEVGGEHAAAAAAAAGEGVLEVGVEGSREEGRGSKSDSESTFRVRDYNVKSSKPRRKSDSTIARSRRVSGEGAEPGPADDVVEAWEAREEGYKRQIADAEEQFEKWRRLAVELATEALRSPALNSAADSASRPLVEYCRGALRRAVADAAGEGEGGEG